ncbi:putative disease resistance protein RGA1 [Lotus japonicus]|uniref:putative disease resistance protein RGA1 n=1 Tax=Lotus japonicus TaxID=34305 RepID=UPI0025875CCD|nr:putative disease resistance protein RGA1 [Lotus japonicus]
MAEALLGAVFEKLLSLAQNEFATMSGIQGKAKKLSNTLELIKAVVEDAEEKQITNKPIKVWLQQLKDAVYILDDILDECSIESLRLKGLSSLKPKSIKFRYEIGNKLKEISRRFDEIADQKNKYVLQEVVRERSTDVAEWRQTSSIIPQAKLYGREDDKEKIVKFLLSQARESDFLSIYPIVGLGGMGKTTLAQMVYNDDQVTSNFNIKVWICVSENFSVQRILCSIIESITKAKHDCLNLDVTERKVQELLQGKRYFLVLDDVWRKNEEMKFGLTQDKWNKLKCVLSCASKGASILVSTRDMKVAAIMGTCQAHHLCGLSEDECWMLFKQYAFGTEKEERAELVPIGKEIVKTCGGSPLAAQALGGLLFSRSEEKEWLEVMESGLWNLEGENSILAALRLSYFHLTPTLRQCFAFCAIFPKDTEIMKEDLIHLWMANGFISSRANLEVEDVGNMIWNELYQKSFFQDMKLVDYSDVIHFKMHDLVHDLALSIMGQECMVLGNTNMTDLSTSTHHVSFDSGMDVLSLHKSALKKVESLRTFYQLKVSNNVSGCIPIHCSTLRVLRTSSFNLSPLKNLIHLRYLELFKLEIETLPDSIYSLRKLEILKLRSLKKLVCLPKDLTCLQDLRHLVIEDCYSLSCMFPNIGKLSRLRTLSKYIVSSEIGHSLAELHDLKLRGNLHIKGLENVGSLSEAQEANLMGKKDIHKLQLIWDKEVHSKPYATNPKLVLNALQPHSNLKNLKIEYSAGLQLPTWMEMLTNLVSLKLYGCEMCVRLPSLGKLPYLRRIKISEMNDVQYMDDDESDDGVEVKAFPSLEKLSLSGCSKLERLLKVERGENFPCLSDLAIRNCPKLELPSCCIPSLKKLHLEDYTDDLLRSLSCFNGLTSLRLYAGDVDLTSFPVGTLTCLQTLWIRGSKVLKELPNEIFKNLNNLEYLSIGWSSELESLPEQGWEGLRSLRTLGFWDCGELKSLPDGVRHLTSLQLLNIYYCRKLESLPEQGWEGLRSLRTLGFWYCGELKSLPDGVRHLTSLQLLNIRYCRKLESLPEQGWEGLRSLRTLQISGCGELKSLPDGVRHLTSLQLLSIAHCPALAERCKEGTGEDWDKIAHVSKVQIINSEFGL